MALSLVGSTSAVGPTIIVDSAIDIGASGTAVVAAVFWAAARVVSTADGEATVTRVTLLTPFTGLCAPATADELLLAAADSTGLALLPLLLP